MSMLYNGKTWYEMTPEEQKVYLIIVGIMVLALFIYGIYYFIKKEKIKTKLLFFVEYCIILVLDMIK